VAALIRNPSAAAGNSAARLRPWWEPGGPGKRRPPQPPSPERLPLQSRRRVGPTRTEKSSFAGRMGLSGQENLQDLATSAFSGQQSAMGASAAEAQVLASMTYIEMLE